MMDAQDEALLACSDQVERLLAKPRIHQQWERDYRSEENEQFFDHVFDTLLAALDLRHDELFLDAGCGIGAHAARLARHGFHVQAVDCSEMILETARSRIHEQGLEARIRLQREDLRELSFADDSFEHVLCWGVLMHVSDLETTIRELARVLKPGGFLIISEASRSSLQAMALRALKRLFRRESAAIRVTPAGVEYWAATPEGTLLTREADIAWLIDQFQRKGLTLRKRLPGQFTEAYTRVSSVWLRKRIHRLNRFWFDRVKIAPLAFANILVLRKENAGIGESAVPGADGGCREPGGYLKERA